MSIFLEKIDKNEKGIWKYARFYDEFIRPENRLSLDNFSNKNDIPICRWKDNFIENLYFKREDKNPTGSLKDRSLVYQISLAKQNGKKELVISTSGNAGISAATYCAQAGIKLYIFISPETEKAKIAQMQKYSPIIIKSKKAIRFANYLSARYKTQNLRPSIDDSSIEGFKSIAFEIFQELGEIDALFIYVTSGSSFVGIGRAYKYLLESGKVKKLPKLFAVQSGNIFSIVKEFEKNINQEKSKAGKLGIKNTRRKNEILEIIKLSKGSGIYINNKEIKKATKLLEKNNIYTSPEGCANFVASIKKSKDVGFKKVVCIFSGEKRNEINEINENKIYRARNFEDIDKIVASNKH